MQRNTFKIVFFCKKTKINKKGKAPIYVRITTDGVSTEIFTKCQIEPEHWNQRAERSLRRNKVDEQINNIITTFRYNILAVYDQLTKEGKNPTCQAIKLRLANPYEETRAFLAEFSKYAEKRQGEVGTRIVKRTAEKYFRMLRYLREYTSAKYKKEDLPLEQINYEYVDGLYTFLQTAHNCHHNGAITIMRCLRTFMLFCIRNEWIEKTPFQHFKLHEEKNKEKAHLTKDELDTIIRKPLNNTRLERVRDVFAFCCLTGLAFSDAANLRTEHLSSDDKGVWWIHKPREKTSIMSQIPLLPYSLKILEKYKSDRTTKVNGKLLPVLSNQCMNAYLKELAGICNIDKTLTTHVARHTFACLAVEYGMPIDVLAKILGHTYPNMTRHYAKFSEDLIGREMMKIGDIIIKTT